MLLSEIDSIIIKSVLGVIGAGVIFWFFKCTEFVGGFKGIFKGIFGGFSRNKNRVVKWKSPRPVYQKKRKKFERKRIAKKQKTYKKEVPKVRICSRCGAKMVIRVAKKGVYKGKRFYGCSKYPKCKNIVSL